MIRYSHVSLLIPPHGVTGEFDWFRMPSEQMRRYSVWDLSISYEVFWFDHPDWIRPQRQGVLRRLIDSLPKDYYERRAQDGRTERFQMVVWTPHPDRPPFMLVDGAVQIKSPDKETIQKMVEMAGRLRARAVGEVYPLDPPAHPQVSHPTKHGFMSWPLWKQLLVAFLVGSVLLALKLLIFGG